MHSKRLLNATTLFAIQSVGCIALDMSRYLLSSSSGRQVGVARCLSKGYIFAIIVLVEYMLMNAENEKRERSRSKHILEGSLIINHPHDSPLCASFF